MPSNHSSDGVSIIWEDKLTPTLKVFGPAVLRAVGKVMEANAPRVQSYARSSAPWTDRTGNARNGLFAKYRGSNSSHAIDLYHTVPYGIFLEVRWSGRYQVIRPTIDAEGRRIMTQMRGVISAIELIA